MREYFYNDESYENYLYACDLVDKVNALMDEGNIFFEDEGDGVHSPVVGRFKKQGNDGTPMIVLTDRKGLGGLVYAGWCFRDGLIIMDGEGSIEEEKEDKEHLLAKFMKFKSVDPKHLKTIEF